ncbi:MAG: class I SAM-dependent methyltransferase [Halosimplex sp.]
MDDRELVRRGYDEFAETYAERNASTERERAILDEFLDSIADPNRLLDAGCGHGTDLLRRTSESKAVVGLDISRAQLGLAPERVPDARFVHGDMTTLPFDEGAFDAVVAYRSLIHVPRPDHQRVLEEFARVLRPGGGVLLSEAPVEFDRETDDWLDAGGEMTWSTSGAEATRRHLRAAGFTVLREWGAPEPEAGEPPRPPFFAGRLDT